MAITASRLITKALNKILVQASEQPVEGSEMSDAIEDLNNMMAEFSARGIALGYTEVTNPANVITVAPGAINGMIFNLAMRLASEYNVTITAALASAAKAGFSAMLDIAVTVKPTELPCILPVGSGNEGDGLFDNDRFFPCPTPDVLTEGGGSIDLESGT